MITLTKASIITRKIIRYGIFSIIGIIILRASILTGIKVYRHFFPEPPPPPTVSFGRLPKLPFPKKDVPKDISLKIETATGELPVLPQRAKVYYMPKPFSQLLSLDVAKQKASNLGFIPNGVKVTDTIYQFNRKDTPSQLRISIVSGVFSISYNLNEDPSPLETRPLPPEVAASRARSYLSRANLLPDDLTGPTNSEPVKLEGNKIIGAISLSEANFVKVNLFRKSFDNFPSLTADPNKANVWLIISGESQNNKQIIAAEYHYFPVDESQSATYPIKTAQAAWEEFVAGGGYIASLGDAGTNVIIRKIYLAYYDAGVPTDFYQPIIVFEGDKGFVGYVPAVTNDYYGE